ncbi:sugar ABC transporter substrate-binding protein [Baekduia alba]|uniref:sugar ABC transporter substrate-binding protein n=1 Tax=Baekduia alba TaxID=2997333 RepID=UPI0023411BE4|nr:substrate-binding domain-containing protein [Baekduia alba]
MLGVAACGSSSDSSTTNTGKSGDAKVDVAAAKAFIAPLVSHPSAFPVTEPLAKRPAPGTRVAFLDLGTPVAALQWTLIQSAGKAMGLDVYRVRGQGAQGVSAALDTIVEQKPKGVIFLAADPTLFARQLTQLRKEGTTVVAGSIVNGAKFGFKTVQFGAGDAKNLGEILAAWTIARSEGKAHDVVFYTVPELDFASIESGGVKSKLKELCPACTLRVVSIPIAEVAKGASGQVVSDLQAHPDTDFAVFATDEMQLGLPAALRTAGIDVPTVGGGATPGNLQAIKDGQQDASVGSDLPILTWTMIDQLAREMGGQALSGPEAKGTIVQQVLRKQDITFDPAKGWTGYPDFAQRFVKLWGAPTGQ